MYSGILDNLVKWTLDLALDSAPMVVVMLNNSSLWVRSVNVLE